MSTVRYHLMACKVLLILTFAKYGETRDKIPDLCDHSARFDTLTQYYTMNGTKKDVMFFITSGGYYWILSTSDYPSANNTKGKLPNGFRRGDAAFFRSWPQCVDPNAIPQIIVVENFENETDSEKCEKFMSYFIENNTWSSPKLFREDVVLKHFNHNKSSVKATSVKINTIINFSNIKAGPFANKFGNEFLYIFTTQTVDSITDYYYSRIYYVGCGSKGIIKGSNYTPVKQTLWKMKKPIDAAFVYTEYPDAEPGVEPINGDIALFQENTHYQFDTPLKSIVNEYKAILDYNNLLAQYYSTWMDCASGATPEPPVLPTDEPVNPLLSSTIKLEHDIDPGVDEKTLDPLIPDHTHIISSNVKDTFKFTLISTLFVIITLSILLTISVSMARLKSNEDNAKSNKINNSKSEGKQKSLNTKVTEAKSKAGN